MKANKLWGLILALLVFSGLFLIASLQPALGQEVKPLIDIELQQKLAQEGQADFFVVMKEKADLSAAFEIEDWSKRGWYVYNALLETARQSQVDVIAYAEAHGLEYRSFYTVNSVYFPNGTGRMVDDLAMIHGVSAIILEGYATIQPEKILPLIGPEAPPDENISAPNAHGWNLDALDPAGGSFGMQAAQVWDEFEVTGEGIVVANIDTGAYYEHEALVNQYRGNLGGNSFDHDYNWYMPTSGCGNGTYPCDNHGHGSGTIGIMIGRTADGVEEIGVAPGAKWIACKGCEENGCSDAALTSCADWMIAPCPIGAAPGDPSCDPDTRPHVINNSWGSTPGGDNWYQGYIEAWIAAGQFPAFSAGNAYTCNSLGSPGDNPPAFSTAAHDNTGVNYYAGGPSAFFPNPSCDPMDHEIDPHVNAPTFGRSASNSQGAYYNLSGTSGASPHTAGTVALLWSANPTYIGNIEGTFYALEQAANRDFFVETTCGKPACAGAGSWPNYDYGWGYLDAYAAIQMVGLASTGTLRGTVTEGIVRAPGDPLADVHVHAKSNIYTLETTTGADGIYSMEILTGTYDVTASKYGFLPESVSGIVISDDMTTTLDFALLPADLHIVEGSITDANTGWPLYAQISIDGYPGDPIWTNPETGYYSITLAAGITYTFNVEAWVLGYVPSSGEVGPLTGDTTENFTLDVNAVTCNAPGYYVDSEIILTETFDTWPITPTWTIVNNGGDCDWQAGSADGDTNNTGGSSDYADADSDACGSGTFMDTELWSPVMDLTGYSDLTFEFKSDMRFYTADVWDVDMSLDGGATWNVNLLHRSGQSYRGPETIRLPMPGSGGDDDVVIRFRYQGDFDYWWQVDDVMVASLPCLPNPGGLVVGNIYDANTLDAVNGSMVENEDGYMAEAVQTPLDDNVDDGFYTIFSPAGSQTFTATMGTYASDVNSVAVVVSDTVSQNFHLPAAAISVAPIRLEVSVVTGYSTTVPLTLTNSGAIPTTFSIDEQPLSHWVNTNPNSGTIVENDTVGVDVNFDATSSTGGTYRTTLKIKTKDPLSPIIDVPVTMHVVTSDYQVTLSDDDAMSNRPGAVVTYTVTITNSGIATDTFDLEIDGQTWTTTLSTNSISLNPSASATFEVSITIPEDAESGESDTVSIIATSQNDPLQSNMVTLTTTALTPEFRLYLPTTYR